MLSGLGEHADAWVLNVTASAEPGQCQPMHNAYAHRMRLAQSHVETCIVTLLSGHAHKLQGFGGPESADDEEEEGAGTGTSWSWVRRLAQAWPLPAQLPVSSALF